jgi:hypothetical protein
MRRAQQGRIIHGSPCQKRSVVVAPVMYWQKVHDNLKSVNCDSVSRRYRQRGTGRGARSVSLDVNVGLHAVLRVLRLREKRLKFGGVFPLSECVCDPSSEEAHPFSGAKSLNANVI